MVCDEGIHDQFIELGEGVCHFCDEVLIKGSKIDVYTCCDNQNIENVNSFNTCLSCGEVLGYTTFANDYIDFHENILKMRKKSVYNRFYYIENCLNRLCSNGLILSYKRRAMIYKIFDLIDITMPKINYDRKRLISINYILSMLFKMMGITYDIEISKSKKTLKYYKKYWDDVMSLIGDQIHSITNQKRDYKCYLLKV